MSSTDYSHLHTYDTAVVSELLKRKRKAREVKACFPCRHRKIRCDGKSPCTSCVERDHASLCQTVSRTSAMRASSESRRSITVARTPPSASTGSPAPSTGSADEDTMKEHALVRLVERMASNTRPGPQPQLPPARDLLARADGLSLSPGFEVDVEPIIRQVETMEEQLAVLKAQLLSLRRI
ncbi:hypothetical protein QBC42DRAFT_284307 [Cladorrhinum samala]|uniref:Zn(2)-C6 fungal-type domain-containing protein n=1 Tax=Cladorrhinum samala TaxID=585594 RepID=A0AAV9HUL0_9PEZI|nr:hypothetical protein QBC42DRAFT_284307 [Cladorrhinum samala]